MKTRTEFHYGTTLQERYHTGLNRKVEKALYKKGYRNFYLTGDAKIWEKADTPNAAYTWVVFENLPKEEIPNVLKAIEETAQREVTYKEFSKMGLPDVERL